MSATRSTLGQERSEPIDRNWRSRLNRALIVTVTPVLVRVVFDVYSAWFSIDSADVSLQSAFDHLAINYSTVSMVVIAAWMIVLRIYHTRDARISGTAAFECNLFTDGLFHLFGTVAIVSAIYAQERTGLNGQSFMMCRLRSIQVNVYAELDSMHVQLGTGDRPPIKVKKDPRVTRIRRFPRKHSSDMFPQLLNPWRKVDGFTSISNERR